MFRRKIILFIVSIVLAESVGGLVGAYAQDNDHQDSGKRQAAEHQDEDSIALSEDTLKEQGITQERVQARTLNLNITLNGRLRANEDRLVHLIPRFGGIIKEVTKQLGDEVKKGDLLATVESNQTLQPYEVRAPIAGVIVKRHAAIGELAKESEEIFEIADLSELWADLYVFPDNFKKIQEGQSVLVGANGTKISTVISFVSAHVDPATQSKFARAVVSNSARGLYPGQFIRGDVVEGKREVKVAVKSSALQRWEGNSIVFVPRTGKIVSRVVSTGAADGEYTEIINGLAPEDEYYTGNVFVLKAELGKALASHDH